MASLVDETPAIIVVRFAPWHIPKGSALAANFLGDLGKKIRKYIGGDASEAFNQYVKRLVEIGSASGHLADIVAPGTGSIISRSLSNVSKSYENRDKTLEELKIELAANLKKLSGQKFLIIIDDLDRLFPKELMKVLSIVKGLGDLPNIVYLLSYDFKEIVGKIETAINVSNGAEYLEKIIQFRRQLPELENNALSTLLSPFLEPAITDVYHDNATLVDIRKRFSEAWREVVQNLLITPRDVIQVGNSFFVVYADVRLHVDPVDLFLIETLNYKRTDLVRFIRRNLDALCGEEFGYAGPDGALKLKGLVIGAGFLENSIEVRALSLLFPRVAQGFKTYGSSDKYSKLRKRIHSRECANAYFDITAPASNWSKEDQHELFEAEDKSSIIAQIIIRSASLAGEGANFRIQFLEAFVSYFGDGTPIDEAWLIAFVSNSVDLIRLRDESLSFLYYRDNLQRLENLIFRGLDAAAISDRPTLLLVGLRASSDISLMCAVTRVVLGDVNSDASVKPGLNFGDDTDRIRKEYVKAIVSRVKDGTIWNQVRVDKLLWFWWGATDGKAVREFLSKQIMDDSKFEFLVSILTTQVFSSNGNYTQVPIYMDKIIDLESFSRWAEFLSVNNSSLSEVARKFLESRRRADDER